MEHMRKDLPRLDTFKNLQKNLEWKPSGGFLHTKFLQKQKTPSRILKPSMSATCYGGNPIFRTTQQEQQAGGHITQIAMVYDAYYYS